MKVLAIEQEMPNASAEAFQLHGKAEAERAWDLYQAGIIRELYFRGDQHTAVLILECADETEAQEILATLPLVKEGLIRFDTFPLVPYPGFARLFS
jgi:muconolactone delta-isomerase